MNIGHWLGVKKRKEDPTEKGRKILQKIRNYRRVSIMI